jgi:DNA (cytosine-5)-methyltransferase 1
MEKFTFIDLFAGIGGFRLALNNLGGKCINFSEVNKEAINTYCENYNEDAYYNLGDITKIKELPSHDLLTGGVPCQSWSIAGKNLGFEDDRGQLWNDTIFLLNKSKPKAFIFENVKGLVDPRNKEAFDYILSQIRKAGYFVNYYLLSSSDYGVPQSRVRVYLIGFREKNF